MKKYLLMITLLLMNSSIFSQSIDTKNISIPIPQSQLKEFYKGLKQGEYLKVRLEKTEKALQNAGELISEQKSALENTASLIKAKDQMIANNEEIFKQEKIIYDSRITTLQADYKILEIQSKKTARKKLWTGIKIGGFSVAIIGVAGLLLIK